ncbi:MAG: D-tyrosyl-tRNA(Tyr) deacylase [Ignavibacteriae bacterium HGW-Ignavibacteriae-2]|jgi:D-tyrosyl-tRNA(Tyr) deacylase|nr:D-tyrosyl-tRNA(Tyr) deacylase [Bacteroidota bacterium]PKL87255.1 MAG: D-tyrosyl-tRNA(Tyr) deacylase [Ignavibacteriae bacterium HGW-Ignavibacteriae-2]
MRALVQRVSEGSVKIKSQNYNQEIGKGMVLLLGVKQGDTLDDVVFVADKCCNLRIFEDENEKMNLSLKDINGEILIISQFTLYGDARKGNRPSFTNAADPAFANDLYEKFVERVKLNIGKDRVKTGVFAAMMNVKIINDGPVTILVQSKDES